LCGLAHFRMRGVYTVQPQADYDAWLAREAALIQ
jgi:heme/copper-type cytochrome/quinol oxidase subunit 2